MIKNYTEWLNEDNGKEKLTPEQIEWCDKHIAQKWWVNEKGEVEVEDNVDIKPGDVMEFPVQFANTKGRFSCASCTSLTSLKGAPRNVQGSFDCSGCTSLTSLEGAPRIIDGEFECRGCKSLTSLEGSPEKVKKDFICSVCKNLSSLKGASPYIGGEFYYEGNPDIPQEEKTFHKNTPDLFFDWLKTGLSFKEYQAKYSAKIKGNKFGL